MDIDQRIDTLERRLSAMERKSRTWRILALLLLVALVGGAASEGVFDNASWAADEKASTEGIKSATFDSITAKSIRLDSNETGVSTILGPGTILVTSHDLKTSFMALVSPIKHKKGYTAGIALTAPPKTGRSSIPNIDDSGLVNGSKSHAFIVINSGASTAIGSDTVAMFSERTMSEFVRIQKKHRHPLESPSPVEVSRWHSIAAHPDIVLNATLPDSARFELNNLQGKPVVELGSTEKGRGSVSVNDENGKNGRFLVGP